MVYEDIVMGLFDAIQSDINGWKGFGLGLINNAISYSQSKKAQARAYNYARLLQQQQYDLTQQGYRESSSNIRTGLESAGFNPMLAVNGGNAVGSANVAGGTPVNASQPDSPDLASNAQDMIMAHNQTQQTQSNIDLQEKQGESAEATAANQNAQAAGQVEDNKYISERNKAAIQKMQGETTYFKQLGDNLQARLQLDRELGFAGLANNRDVAHIYANASKYGADVSAGANRYGADKAYESSIYGSNTSTYNSWINSGRKDIHGFGFGASWNPRR